MWTTDRKLRRLLGVAISLLLADLLMIMVRAQQPVAQSNPPWAVSAASWPLPTGASTEATLALIKAKTDNLDVLLSTRLKPADTLTKVSTLDTITNPVPVTGTFWQATQPVSIAATITDDVTDRAARLLGHVTVDNASLAVTGTFWQATQPVSATSWPLPTNAAQETGGNLALISAAVQNPQLTQSVNWVGGWPWSMMRPGVPLVGIDQVTGTWINGFGARGRIDIGPGASGGGTLRVATANDVVNVSTGTLSSINSVIGPMSLDGAAGVECFVGAGFTGTLLFQYGPDALGTYGWATSTTQFAGGTTALPSFTGGAASVNPLLGQGARYLKVSVLIYTSGSAPTTCVATKLNSPLAIPGLLMAVPTAAVPALAMETHDITRELQTCTFGWGGPNAALGTTLTQCFALTAGLRWYIIDIDFISTTATASTVQLKYGTGTNCGTGTQNLTIVYATPLSTATPTHFFWGSADGTAALGNAVCAVGGSATNTTQLKVTAYQAR